MPALTLPTYLTLARMALAALVAIAFLYFPTAAGAWTAAALFAAASILDFLDGYLARRLNLVSQLGRMLDPIADKVLVVTVLVVIMARSEQAAWLLPPVLVIVVREIGISGLREFLAKDGIALPSTLVAKCKTSIQFVAVLVLLVAEATQSPSTWNAANENGVQAVAGWEWLMPLGAGLLWLAAVLTLASGMGYLRAAIGRNEGTFRQ